MFILSNINTKWFLISFALGLLLVYCTVPKPEVIIKYPTPDNADITIFKDDIDIGRISSFNVFGTSFEVDVLPDTMEKAIYKKCIKIIFAMILEMKDNV